MDILQHILQLREDRNWTEYELSVNAGIPQSTISSWYRKNAIPTVPSLECICSAFHITLSQFFAGEDEPVTLTASQKELLEQWNRLDETHQEKLLDFLKTL